MYPIKYESIKAKCLIESLKTIGFFHKNTQKNDQIKWLGYCMIK